MKTTARLGIVGSGLIATGLAACAARTSSQVLWARSTASADKARAALSRHCDRLDDGHDPAKVTFSTDLSDMSSSTYLVEAIVEDLAAKGDLLARLGQLLAPGAVLASTTSSLCIRTLAAASSVPERFAGLHVFKPVPKMRLMEVAFSEEASAETPRRTVELCMSLDKEPIEAPAIPGYVVNTLLFPYLFHAVEFMQRHDMVSEMVDARMQMGVAHPWVR